MMVTGCPAISLFATCGSEPIDLLAPFGGRQGTRANMSFILSTARAAMLFCGGLFWAAALPLVLTEGASAGFVASDLAASDLGASALGTSALVASALGASALASLSAA